MNIYKIIVSYKGTRYVGFQVQANGKTIQGEINSALKILSKSDEVKSIGSGRTDAGVHALAQVMRIEIPVFIPADRLILALNSNLPDDIRVIDAAVIGSEFHPIFSAKSKEYNYVFSTEQTMSPFAVELMTHFPFDLDLKKMQEGCKIFCGEHDFINYQCVGTEVEHTVRKIISCEIIHLDSEGHWGNLSGDYYVLKIVGTGFLKQMVRLMMGALISLGKGKITIIDLENSLKTPLKNRLGPTAPPQGLYLKEVHY
ncbi:MAG: tRNA pseudouridine(38-40) synthase TruA [Bdellovibrionales bacterium]|nr:tRNA pseudouridine(38-40) synthase TruA [Bdellovibrionales bacterium]